MKITAEVTNKLSIAVVKERTKKMLAKLKDVGPFTSDMEIDQYTVKERNATKRQSRMKMEVQFAFQNLTRIEITLPSKTRRHKTVLL